MRDVRGPEYGGERHYLRVYMAQLRRKLEADPARPRHLRTEPGVGYRLLDAQERVVGHAMRVPVVLHSLPEGDAVPTGPVVGLRCFTGMDVMLEGTMRRAWRGGWLVMVATACAAAVFAVGAAADDKDTGFWVITPEEAAQPDAPPETPPPIKLRTRGTTTPEGLGPKVEMISPPEGKPTSTPLTLWVKFTPNVAPIDLESLKVKLVKVIKIDITDRLRPFVTPEGINIPDAKFPSGKFRVKLTLADVKGNFTEGETDIVIN